MRTIFKTQFWSGTLGDTITTGNLTVAAGVRYDLQQAKNLPGTSFANTMFANPCTNCGADGGSFPGLPEVKYHGATDWQFDYTNWQPRVSATYALGREEEHAAAGLVRAVRGPARLPRLLRERRADLERLLLLLDRPEPRPHRPAQRGPVRTGSTAIYNGIDPADSARTSRTTIQPGLKTPATNEVTVGVDQQLTDDFAVSGDVLLPQHEQPPADTVPIGVEPLGPTSSAAGATGTRHARQRLHAHTSTSPSTASRSRGADRRHVDATVPGATQRYYGVDFSVVKRLSGPLDAARQLRLEQLQAVSDAASRSRIPTISGISGGQNDNGGLATGCSRQGANVFINASWQFNVNGLYQGPWGLDLRRQLLRAAGLPESLLRPDADARRRGISHACTS